MLANRIWILGAADPEMEATEALLRECGERVVYTTDPVHVGDARDIYVVGESSPPLACGEGWDDPGAYHEPVKIGARYYPRAEADYTRRIAHIRPRLPGTQEEILPASIVGRVIAELARAGVALPWESEYVPGLAVGRYFLTDSGRYLIGTTDGALYVPPQYVHAAAYRGECPGVDPDALMRWRAETRAAHQGRSVEDVLADVAIATMALRRAPLVNLSAPRVCKSCGAASFKTERGSRVRSIVRDLRGRNVSELPEAAAREGVAYLTTVFERNGRKKVVLGGHTTPELVRAFMEHWAPAHGRVGIHGDPARGFACAYFE